MLSDKALDVYTNRMDEYWSPGVLSQGFVGVPIWLLESRLFIKLNPSQFLVLITLCSFRYSNQAVFPTVQTISRRCGVDERSVRRATAKMEKLGLINKVRRFGSSSYYDLNPLTETLEYYLDLRNRTD